MNTNRKVYFAMVSFVLVCWNAAQAQVAPATILTVDAENTVQYIEDPVTVDLSG